MNHLTNEEQSAFWNAKSQVFPRYEDKEDNYEGGMLRRIENLGVDFRGKSILDVGCGTGMYTIRLGKTASRITALDISKEMLDILNFDAKANGVSNITTVHSGWDSFQTDVSHDIAFCSMTPAIMYEGARRKLTDMAGEQAVYMGFDGVMQSDVLDHLYPLFGIEQRDFSDAKLMRQWLKDNGYSYRDDVAEGEWVVMRSKELMVENAAAMLSTYRIEPDRELISRNIEKFRNDDGTYTDRVAYRIGVIVWSK